MQALQAQVQNAAMQKIGIARVWSSALCDCSRETQSCLDVFCCMPCQISRQCQALDGVTNNMDCCTCCLSMIAMYYGNAGAGVLAAIIRYRIIAKYNITGEGNISTFCNAMCCFPCSLCQTHRELTAIGVWPGGTCCGSAGPQQMK